MKEILDQWWGEGARYFKVRADDDNTQAQSGRKSLDAEFLGTREVTSDVDAYRLAYSAKRASVAPRSQTEIAFAPGSG